jgi:hypothetical protein
LAFGQDDVNPYKSFEHQFQVSATIPECPEVGPFPFVLNDPYISARKKSVILSYEVVVPDPEWITYEVFDPLNCSIPIPTGDSGSEPLIPTFEISHGALTGAATAKLTLEVNEAGLKEYGSLIYSETERTGVAPYIVSTGDVTFCVRMSIFNGLPSKASSSDGQIQVVTWIDVETSFVAELDIEDESMLDFTTAEQRSCSGENCRQLRTQDVKPDRGSAADEPMRSEDASTTASTTNARQQRHLCETTWGMEIISCPDTIDENTTTPFTLVKQPNKNPFAQNEFVRLCIQPNAGAREGGLTLKGIENLYYRALPLVQPGVESGYVSADGMTSTVCGDNMCVVESLLYDQFFGSTNNEVMVSGIVLFQPSNATFYSQTYVEFELPIMVLPSKGGGEGEVGGSAAFSAKSIVSMALMATGMLALLL